MRLTCMVVREDEEDVGRRAGEPIAAGDQPRAPQRRPFQEFASIHSGDSTYNSALVIPLPGERRMKKNAVLSLALGIAAVALAAPSLLGDAQPAPAARTIEQAGPLRFAAFPRHRPGVDVRPRLGSRRLRGESRRSTTSARRTAACGRRRTTARRSRPSSRTSGLMSIGDVAVSQSQPGPGLGRHRRIEQPPEHVVGRRRLQVHRRRQDLREHGPAHLAPHQPHRHRPARQQRRLRRGHRQPLGPGRRARRLQDDRRRQDLEAGAEGRRRHRRQRPRRWTRRTAGSSTRPPTSGAGPPAA